MKRIAGYSSNNDHIHDNVNDNLHYLCQVTDIIPNSSPIVQGAFQLEMKMEKNSKLPYLMSTENTTQYLRLDKIMRQRGLK